MINYNFYRYKVYRNLHKNCFSILKYNRITKRFRLYEHVTDAYLFDVIAKVSEAGRQRVIHQKQKNIHAFLLCHKYTKQLGNNPIYVSWTHKITYNPYENETFMANHKVFKSSDKVVLTSASSTPEAHIFEN